MKEGYKGLGITKKREELTVETVTNLIYQSTGGDTNRLIEKGFSLVKGTLSYNVFTTKYMWNGLVTEDNRIDALLVQDQAPAISDHIRFDTFVFNDDLTFSIVKGEEGLNPAHPAINDQTQIKLTTVLVRYGEITPADITDVLLWNEGTGEPTEFTFTKKGVLGWIAAPNITESSTDVARDGAKSIKIDSAHHSEHFILRTANEFQKSSVDNLLLSVYCGNDRKHRLSIYTFLEGDLYQGTLSLKNGNYGFDTSKVGVWQDIIIPISDYGMYDAPMVGFAFKSTTNIINGDDDAILYVDNIRLQGGFNEAQESSEDQTTSEDINNIPFSQYTIYKANGNIIKGVVEIGDKVTGFFDANTFLILATYLGGDIQNKTNFKIHDQL